MHDRPKESDWKIFHKRKPEWRERSLREKNKEILRILTDEERTPTRQFWDAKKKMEEEAEILRTCLDPHARSKMFSQLSFMYGYGLIHD